MKLTDRTISAIETLFLEDRREQVAELLLSYDRGCERTWLAMLKVSNGNMQLLHEAVTLAKTDFRDLLMNAGFGEDLKAHERWTP